ncbi:hypothetical protein [Limimaricola litoreus]|uniref:Uncharacterized protein n=1 Tax=Limimaricola litoreus TaxID=2955316 RepID=A0A9X2FRG3_9RHOB|nr:hypothetical protein [Limimaricola litoreus]MCP1170557.1 hypothetical protein [Limimaricola litoreus]
MERETRSEKRAGPAMRSAPAPSLGAIDALQRGDPDAPPRPIPDLSCIDPSCRMEKASRCLHDTAAQLCVLPSRLRRRIRARQLLGFWSEQDKCWKLPEIQFDGPLPLTGLAPILQAMPAHMQPADIYGFLTTPQPDLEDETGRAMTAAAWLRKGGDAGAVIRLIEA